jgi:hypothetical protein
MSVSLVSITHPIDPNAEIPFVGGRAPLNRVAVETWKVKHIAAMGFAVEVHAEPYDPVAESNKEAAKLAEALAAGTPVVVEEPVQQAPVAAALEPTPAPAAAAVEDGASSDEQTEGEGSDEQQPGAEEGEGLTEEEIAALRARVEALTTKADAEALIAEYGIQLDPLPSKLKDIKAQLLAMIDGE